MAVLDLEGRELQDFSLFDIDIDMGENHLIHLRQAKTELPNDAKCLALNAHEMQDGGKLLGFVLSRSKKIKMQRQIECTWVRVREQINV